jgi:mRNA interferase RelE/StbE
MSIDFIFTAKAKKDIDGLEKIVRNRLGKKLLQYSTLDDITQVAKKLENSSIGDYRLRVGDYRILFDLELSTVVVLRVQHRKDVYKKL